MEQKHIDDLDESFLGEEFIDEEDILTAVEANESPAQRKKNAVEENTFSVKNKMEKEKKMQKTIQKAKKEVKKAKVAVQKSSKSVPFTKNNSFKTKNSKENKEKETLREVPEITIVPVKQMAPKEVKKTVISDISSSLKSSLEKNEQKTPLEFAAPPVDPWKEEKEEKNSSTWTQEASTWKAVTGIVVVLLLLSVFTQGFRFSSESGGTLSLQEAEERTLNYVNSYLLQPPFTAEAQNAEEVDGLYKVTLSVAGEVVDSYLTRDGKLFFPQGFAIADFEKKKETLDENSETAQLPVEETPEEVVENQDAPVENPDQVETQPAVDADVTTVSLSAKKWIFSPTKLAVPLGKPVALTINSAEDLTFTFAIPGLNVQQEVDEQTTITFTPEKSGSFDFLCSSCEDWRGMKGTLVVK